MNRYDCICIVDGIYKPLYYSQAKEYDIIYRHPIFKEKASITLRNGIEIKVESYAKSLGITTYTWVCYACVEVEGVEISDLFEEISCEEVAKLANLYHILSHDEILGRVERKIAIDKKKLDLLKSETELENAKKQKELLDRMSETMKHFTSMQESMNLLENKVDENFRLTIERIEKLKPLICKKR